MGQAAQVGQLETGQVTDDATAETESRADGGRVVSAEGFRAPRLLALLQDPTTPTWARDMLAAIMDVDGVLTKDPVGRREHA